VPYHTVQVGGCLQLTFVGIASSAFARQLRSTRGQDRVIERNPDVWIT